MARDTDSAYKLDKPEPLDNLLKADRGDDCMPCRVIGGGAFLGLAGYSYLSGTSQLERQSARIAASGSMFGVRSRRAGIAATSFALAWMGVYRLFM